MRYFVVTMPEQPAVSLEEMKAHLRIDHDDDNDQLEELIIAAQAGFESPDTGTLGRPVAAQEIEVEVASCDRYPLRLFGPIDTEQDITVLYRDANGVDVDVDSAAYRIDRAETFSPRLTALGAWRYGDSVRVRCMAGLAADDPRLGNFKTAIKLHVQTIYDGVDDVDRYRATINSLLSTYRVLGI